MGSREVYMEEDLQCDICGEYEAYDFYGDCICQKCLDKFKSKSVAKRQLKQRGDHDKDN
jgi:hypothetical protein